MLTVLSRISDHCVGFRAATVIVEGLDPDLIRDVRGSSRYNKLGNVGHVLGGPAVVHIQLSPLDSVLQTRPVGLETSEWLHRKKEKMETIRFVFCFVFLIESKIRVLYSPILTVQLIARLPGSVPRPLTSVGF